MINNEHKLITFEWKNEWKRVKNGNVHEVIVKFFLFIFGSTLLFHKLTYSHGHTHSLIASHAVIIKQTHTYTSYQTVVMFINE